MTVFSLDLNLQLDSWEAELKTEMENKEKEEARKKRERRNEQQKETRKKAKLKSAEEREQNMIKEFNELSGY